MKQVIYKINTSKGVVQIEPQSKDTILNELENISCQLTFIFDKPIPAEDKLLIMFVNGTTIRPDKLDRISSNKFSICIPREVMQKGRLYFTVHHYDKDLVELTKYTPEPNYLYINQSLDLSLIAEKKPDIFAELYYRIQRLEEKIFKAQE